MKINEITDTTVSFVSTKTLALKRECSIFIKSSSMPIFRGSYSVDDRITEVPIRTDRIPISASVAETNCFNLMMEKKFGIKRVRNISMFCTTNFNLANSFGEVSYIFPKNDSKILALVGVEDSISIVRNLFKLYDALLSNSDIENDNGDNDVVDYSDIEVEDLSEIYKFKTLKEAKSKLTKIEYKQFEIILDKTFDSALRSMDSIELIPASKFNKLNKMGVAELMIFNSPSVWGVKMADSYPNILKTLREK